MNGRIYYWYDKATSRLVERLMEMERFELETFIPVCVNDILFRMMSKQLIRKDDNHAVLLWSGGQYHDLSYHFAPNVPYAKSVDDAHCDTYLMPLFVSGATHNYYTLAFDPNSTSLEVLGCNPNYMGEGGKGRTGPTINATYERGVEKPLAIRNDFDSGISSGVVHKSIDLDVVEGFPCEEVYSQANEGVTVDTICENLKALMDRADVVRLDIGGMRTDIFDCKGRTRHDPNPEAEKAVEAYAKILETWLDHPSQ